MDAIDALIAELRDEAIKDGDPETCLGWAAAAAIETGRRWETIARRLAADLEGELGASYGDMAFVAIRKSESLAAFRDLADR